MRENLWAIYLGRGWEGAVVLELGGYRRVC